jgi:hypothetical protein
VVMADSFLEGHKALLMVLFYGLHPIFTNYPWPHYGHSPHMPTMILLTILELYSS